jgi:two-component system, sensor histidine kinase and response regulator
MTETSRRGRVLHIDDEESLRFTVMMLLQEEGYELIQAENGVEGIRAAKENKPDVILLDINMPIMDGFETLQKLKEDEQLRDIPVLMNTANNQEEHQVKAFEAGAADYIAKPAREMELLARLDIHITQYRMLKFRERFLFGLNHDLKSPLAVISGMNSMLMLDQSKESVEQVHDVITQASKKMLDLINNLLDIGKLQSGGMHLNLQLTDFSSLYNEEQSLFAKEAMNKNIELKPLDKKIPINADPNLMKRIFANLLSNAIKFTPEDGFITTSIEIKNNKLLFTLHNSGSTIPEELQRSIFDMYTQVGKGRMEGEGTGLGLSIVYEIVKAHKGDIWVDPKSENGTAFCVEMLLAESA